jgi:hypothetical protein
LSTAEDLEEVAMPLLDKAYHEDKSTRNVRLMGVRLSHFKGGSDENHHMIEGQTTLSFKPVNKSTTSSASFFGREEEEGPALSISSEGDSSSGLGDIINDGNDISTQKKRQRGKYFDPLEVSEEVLSELPPDIAEEIRREMSSSSSSSTSSSSSSSSFPSSSSSSSSSLHQIKSQNLFNKGKKRSTTEQTTTVTTSQLAAAMNGVDPREISEDILNELPWDVQADIRKQMELDAMVRKKKGKEVHISSSDDIDCDKNANVKMKNTKTNKATNDIIHHIKSSSSTVVNGESRRNQQKKSSSKEQSHTLLTKFFGERNSNT